MKLNNRFVVSSLSLVFLAILPTAGLASVPALRFESDPARSRIEFTAIGRPSALKIVGKGGGAQGKLNEQGGRTSGEISFDLTQLETGIAMRDHHMKEKYLETGKFPRASLKLEAIALPASGSAPFAGKLTLHGVEKPVTGTASITRDGAEAKALASFQIKLTDYGIDIPKFAGITIAEDVNVVVDLEGRVASVTSASK